jgi:hypothetical protein
VGGVRFRVLGSCRTLCESPFPPFFSFLVFFFLFFFLLTVGFDFVLGGMGCGGHGVWDSIKSRLLFMVYVAYPLVFSFFCYCPFVTSYRPSVFSSFFFFYLTELLAYPLCKGCKILFAACGGVTHCVVTPDDESKDGGNMTVCWGQNAANGICCLFVVVVILAWPGLNADFHLFFVGELGLGVDEPKSATKPTKHVPLTGIDAIA